MSFQGGGCRWDPKRREGRKSYFGEIDPLQYISSSGQGRTASWQQGSKERGIRRSNRRAQPVKVFFQMKRERPSERNHSFLEGLSILTVIYMKTSLKQTSGKSCVPALYMPWRRQIYRFDALQPVTPIAVWSFVQFWTLSVSTYWLNFCLLSLKISLSYLITEKIVLKLHVMFWVIWYKGHLHIFVENMLVVAPGMAVVSAGFLACFLLLLLPYLLEKMTERRLWNLHNPHSDIYQSVNLKTLSWESG